MRQPHSPLIHHAEASPEDAARELIRRIEKRNDRFQKAGAPPRPVPDIAIVQRLASTAFFASLAHEEGRHATGALLYAGDAANFAAGRWDFLDLASPQPLSVGAVAKLSPALKPGVDFLRVTKSDGDLVIDAIGRWPPHAMDFMRLTPPLAVSFLRPGLLILSTGTLEDVRYEDGNILRAFPKLFGLEDEAAVSPEMFVELRKRILPDDKLWLCDGWLHQIVRQMQRTKQGGILAICMDDADCSSAATAAMNRLRTPLELGAAMREARDIDHRYFEARTGAERAPADAAKQVAAAALANELYDANRGVEGMVSQLARLTAVDGAVIVSSKMDVAAFGAKLGINLDSTPPPTTYCATEDAPDHWPLYPLETRGTRHRAVATWVAARKDRAAVVVSQDGPAGFVAYVKDRLTYWPLGTPPWYMAPPGGG